MLDLTTLVRQYKQSKDNKILEQILKYLNKDIDKRVELIYRKIKHYKIDKSDIKQELYIKILTIIESYNPEEPFENYFFSSIKHWKPKLSKDDVTVFGSLYNIDEQTGDESEINIGDKQQLKPYSNMILEAIFEECQTPLEKQVCELLINNPNLSQEQIAKECQTYKMHISRIINRLRKKLKDFN